MNRWVFLILLVLVAIVAAMIVKIVEGKTAQERVPQQSGIIERTNLVNWDIPMYDEQGRSLIAHVLFDRTNLHIKVTGKTTNGQEYIYTTYIFSNKADRVRGYLGSQTKAAMN